VDKENYNSNLSKTGVRIPPAPLYGAFFGRQRVQWWQHWEYVQRQEAGSSPETEVQILRAPLKGTFGLVKAVIRGYK